MTMSHESNEHATDESRTCRQAHVRQKLYETQTMIIMSYVSNEHVTDESRTCRQAHGSDQRSKHQGINDRASKHLEQKSEEQRHPKGNGHTSRNDPPTGIIWM